MLNRTIITIKVTPKNQVYKCGMNSAFETLGARVYVCFCRMNKKQQQQKNNLRKWSMSSESILSPDTHFIYLSS